MPYLIIDKTIREVVNASDTEPTIDDSNLLVVKVKSMEGYEIRCFAVYGTGETMEDGSSVVSQKWFAGTSFTQEQIDSEVARQENRSAKLQAAINTVITNVNGKAVTALTAIDVRNLLAILMAEKEWINSAGKVEIPVNYTLR